ncbi:calcium-binding protein [Sphingomonas sp. TZW2008]|uniref:beta strand repeat-containing protein n=1 Tax=Sphingomonas sp. TZW2008 TaxID=1917973 RepID=UPI000A26BB48|nr:calcium-binding protein [Sphingomonas sp. TZW2008]
MATVNGSRVRDDQAGYSLAALAGVARDFGAGYDVVFLGNREQLYTQVRLTFTSAEVGNGTATDSGTLANQDGGLAVRVQGEDASGALTGPIGRFDDEGISFVSDGSYTFDVRDLVSGVERGTQFGVVRLGTSGDDYYAEGGSTVATYINGGRGNDDINGGLGDDFLVGGAGNDILFGGRAGNDSFIGGAGDDTISGGQGDDLAIFNISTDGSDSVDLGTGNDRVNVAAATGTTQVRLTFTSAEVGNLSATDAGTLANQDGGLAVRMQAEDGTGALTGAVSRYDDEGVTFLSTTPGLTFDVRDLVSGTARGDQFAAVQLGTREGEVIDNSTATISYYVNGGQGNDTIFGGSANDFLVGGAGADRLVGGAGDDSFIGGALNDTISGGQGNDTAIFNVSTDGSDTVDLGAGADRVNVSAAAGTTQVRLTFTSAEVGNGNASDGGAIADQDGGLAVRVQAEDASGALTGGVSRYDDEGVTFFASTAGLTFDVRDLVSGTARGDQFAAVQLGTALSEVIDNSATTISYYVNGGAGNDIITGGSANDFLVGGAGSDRLIGSAGDDSFIGGGGADTIFGGIGNDIAIFNVSTDGADAVNLGIGDDRVNVSAAAGTTQVRLTFTSAEVGNGSAEDAGTAANQDGGLAVRLQAEDGVGALTGAISRFDDEGITFFSSAGVTFDVRDLVSGTARGDQFAAVQLGTQADDVLDNSAATISYYINGGTGNDTITGGGANDFLVGGAGNDTLNGGANNDQHIGGAGADIFVFTTGPGNDTILDFASGTDKVDLSAFGITADDVSFSSVGGVTFASVDTNADDVADFTIQFAGTSTAPVEGDFVF